MVSMPQSWGRLLGCTRSHVVVVLGLVCLNLSAAQIEKPRVLSTTTTIDFHANDDFTFTFTRDGTVVKLATMSDLLHTLNASMQILNNSIKSLAVIPCALTQWTSWAAASSTGVQTRTRAVIREASGGALSCAEYALSQSRCDDASLTFPLCATPTTPSALDSTDFCDGSERWFMMNAWNSSVIITSNGEQSVRFFRQGRSGGDAYGRLVGNYQLGQVTTVSAQSLLLPDGMFRTGDYFCGTNGSIEVLSRAAASHIPGRNFVPTRLNGTKFVIPVARANSQQIVVMAVNGVATVSLFELASSTSNVTASQMLFLPRSGSYQVLMVSSATEIVQLTSSSEIIVSYVGGVESFTADLVSPGSFDFAPVVPATPFVYGVATRSAFAASVSTTYQLQCTNGSDLDTGRGLLNDPAGQIVVAPTLPESEKQYGCRLQSLAGDVDVGAISVQVAPSNGAVMWTPLALLSTTFIIPYSAVNATLVCSTPGTVLMRVRPTAVGNQRTVPITGSSNVASVTISNLLFLRPGAWFQTTSPCTMLLTPIGTNIVNTVWGSQ